MPNRESTAGPDRAKLSAKLIAALPPVAKRTRGPYDTEITTLYVMRQPPSRKHPGGKRDYYIAFRSPVTGKNADYRIGPGTLAASEVRKRAKTALGMVAAGEDPQLEKVAARREQAARSAGTDTLEGYIRDHYWPDHLAHRPAGKGSRERIEYAWPTFLKRKLSAISELDVTRGKRERLAKVAPQTWNRDLGVLRACLNHAVTHGHLVASPVKPHHRADEVDSSRVRYLGQRDELEDIRIGEEERFWNALERAPDRLRILATLGMKSGARRGELFELTWGAVSLERGTITLEAHTTKSRVKRTVPLPSTVVDMLREWMPSDAKAEDLVVPSPVTGQRIYTLKKSWRALLKDAQITGFRWHDMRHHYASTLVQKGADIFAVSRLLGHTDPELTARRYADLKPGNLQAVAELLA